MYRRQTVRCKYCGRTLRLAWIVNRGHVMAHAKGDGEACRRLIDTGRDMITRAEKAAALKVEQDRLRAEWRARLTDKPVT
jgi:hypothetical protein